VPDAERCRKASRRVQSRVVRTRRGAYPDSHTNQEIDRESDISVSHHDVELVTYLQSTCYIELNIAIADHYLRSDYRTNTRIREFMEITEITVFCSGPADTYFGRFS